VPHGVACALLLPVALRVNRRVRQAELARLAHAIAGKGPAATPEDAVDALSRHIESLCDRIGIARRLSQVGVRREQIPAIVRDSRGSSMSGNPRDLSDEELTEILEDIL
jgi:alcohol dehydrogenase class IV